MSAPQIVIDEFAPANVDGRSVTTAWPAISTAPPHRACRSTKRSEATIAHAAPSEVGEHCSFVSGSWIMRESLISSSVYSVWNCAYGLLTECLWFLKPIQAKCSGFDP